MNPDPLTVDDEPWPFACDHGTTLDRNCPCCEARGGNRAVALLLLALVIVAAFAAGRLTA